MEKLAPQRGWEALKALGWSIQKPRPRNPKAATEAEQEGFKKKSPRSSPKRREAHPGVAVEAFATDEHRIGLKPVVRRVWAPIGVRPVAHGHHR